MTTKRRPSPSRPKKPYRHAAGSPERRRDHVGPSAVRISYNLDLIKWDMAAKGMVAMDLARATGYSHAQVSRVFKGDFLSPPFIKAIAEALDHPVKRYLPPPPVATAPQKDVA